MNIKAITRAMELSDDDWELTTKLRALSEAERELLTFALGPQKPAARKSSKKAGKRSVTEPNRCISMLKTVNKECGSDNPDYVLHLDTKDPNYHEYQPSRLSKSKRQQSLGDAIQRRPRGVVTGDDTDSDERRCAVPRGDLGGAICGLFADHNVHHLESDAGFHPFQPAAQSAEPPSDQASSEIGKGAAGDVHRAAGSGD